MLTLAEMEARLDEIRQSPQDSGRVEMIVRRPEPGEREVVSQAVLDVNVGLVGDNWLLRGSRHTADGSAEFDMQLTLMNARAIATVAQERDRWPAINCLWISTSARPIFRPARACKSGRRWSK